ncbi:hypothetical protein [Streptomyces sp. CC208A]|uniref:hypothetical protein n=1 Tax=Streptomyces sp. CC208A TaxID=3044573 RepID=UPI0024A9D677|nr:hypothetical protein [Streptomyces sp. CC208A]
MATLLVLSASACGGGGDGGEPNADGPTPSATQSQPQSPPSGTGSGTPSPRPTDPPAQDAGPAPDLEAVALKNGDLAEFRMVDVPPIRTEPVGEVSPGACRIVADVRREAYEPRPTALVRRYAVVTGGEHLGMATQVSLAATTEAGARAVLASLRDAVGACAGGYPQPS